MDENTTNGMIMPVAPMYGGSNGFGNSNGFGGDWAWILLLLVLFGGGRWGNSGNGIGGGYFGGDLYPWMNQSNQINDGFRDQMLGTQINGIQSSITSGFGDVQNSLCSGFAGVTAAVVGAQNALAQQSYANQIADLERSFAAQTANTAGLNALQSALAQCCCENRAATADLKYTVATEACADRAAISNALRDVLTANTASTQRILDQLCADKLDEKDNTISQLRQELLYARGQASQVAQNSAIINGVYDRLSQCPVGSVPVFGEQPIFTCPTNVANNCGCGCGNNF